MLHQMSSIEIMVFILYKLLEILYLQFWQVYLQTSQQEPHTNFHTFLTIAVLNTGNYDSVVTMRTMCCQ